jgi:hypothetical protein
MRCSAPPVFRDEAVKDCASAVCRSHVGERDHIPGIGGGHPVVGRCGWHGGEVWHLEHLPPLDAFSHLHDLSSDQELGLTPPTQSIIDEVLLAHRTVPAAAVEATMTWAIASGVLDPQAVLIDARRQAGRPVAPVIPIGALARYDRPAPALDAYDQLLTRTIP